MHREIKIKVEAPCAKNYDKFQPTSAGGYCSSCSKEVVDFTEKSDEAIANYFNNSSEQVCGRFHQHQLKSSAPTPFSMAGRSIGLLAAGLISFSFFSLVTLSNVQAQTTPPATEIMQVDDEKTENTILVSGTVEDPDYGILIGVNIILKGSTVGTTTDINGRYTFPQPLKKGDILIFSYIGYEPKEYVVDGQSGDMKMDIAMLPVEIVIMGDVVVEHANDTKRIKKKKVKSLFE